MNKTKRKIFETSMKLFAEKGYDATSIEEITATVGVAKGTLYYHFSSKEEIFNFLIEEGIKLLQNSIDIKTEKLDNYIDKIKAIVLIEIKIVNKYEDFITILLSQFYGKEARNKMCQQHVFEYIGKIEKIGRADYSGYVNPYLQIQFYFFFFLFVFFGGFAFKYAIISFASSTVRSAARSCCSLLNL